MSQPTPDDPRDAHLVAALRHAPDRDVAPPAQLSAAILDHAQQALRARRPVPASGWHVRWRWLWQPAPMAAFGTLAMATLIGVMWSAQEIPDATPSLRPEAVAVAPAQPLADAPATAKVVPAAPPAPAPTPTPTPTPASRLAERVTAEREPPSPAPAPSRHTTKADLPSARNDRAVGTRTAATEARQAAVAGEAAQTSAMAPAMPAPQPALAARQAAPQEPDSRRDALAKSMADAAPADVRARNEMSAPAAGLGAARPASASPVAAADIAAAMAGDAARVRWRVAAERMVAHEAAQRAWWSAVVRATQGRWQLAASSPAAGAEATSVALLIDGALRGTLAFEPQALLWRDAGGAVWRAAIEPAPLSEWQEALARW